MAKYETTTKDNKCIFCEIVAGRIPSTIFWEDQNHTAFLSIDPNTIGVSVVVPKKHFESDPLSLPDEVLKDLMIASKKVGNILRDYFDDVERVGVIIEGMGMPHMHVKLYPMHGTDYIRSGEWKQFLSSHNAWFPKYEGYISSAGGPMANLEELKELSEKIKNSIK